MVREVFGENFAKSERAILCPTNNDAKLVNDYILSQLPGNAFYAYVDICFFPPIASS